MHKFEETLVKFGMDKNTKEGRKRIIIAVAVLALVIASAIYLNTSPAEEPEVIQSPDAQSASEVKDDDNTTSQQTDGSLFIDVSGAVKNPMVIELESGSRVNDAIEACGGLAENANIEQINRAALLSDGEKVYIPTNEEIEAGTFQGGTTGNSQSGSSGGTNTSNGKININAADETALQQITGVGPATAKKIIDYRQSSGSFKTIEDIKNVSGIGEKTFQKMQDQITV